MRSPTLSSTRVTAVLATAVIAGALLATNLTATGVGDLQSKITSGRSAAASLTSAIAADTAHIQTTTNGLNQARGELNTLQAELAARQAKLGGVQNRLAAARARLLRLKNRLHAATEALAANLVARYENAPPDEVTVLLDSHGFNDLLEQLNFLARMGHQDAAVTGAVRSARAQVFRQATALAALQRRDRSLVREVLGRRNQAAALKLALYRRQMTEINDRSAKASELARLNDQLKSLEARAQRAAAAAAATGVPTAATDSVTLPSAQDLAGGPVERAHINPDGTATAPASAPPAVKAVIAAANQIIDKPYLYAGGHSSWIAPGYDCSGAVSYALHGAGLLSAPLAVQFEGYGLPGAGRWITVYADSQHVFAAIAGLAFDTADFGGPDIPAGSGPRWRYDPTGNLADGGDYVVRHPAGL